FLSGRTDILDIAIIYALINFIGVVAALKLVEQGNFHSSGEEEQGE
ncbi:MAG: pH regulation protein F, partial [Gammaproteobacteria bacterium SG8_11]